jgi:hypothetical protein
MDIKQILQIISIIGIILLTVGSIVYGITQIWKSTENSEIAKISLYTLISGSIIFGINIIITIIYKNYNK